MSYFHSDFVTLGAPYARSPIISREISIEHPSVGLASLAQLICMSVCMYVCRGPKSVGGNTWAKRAHAQSQYCAVKSDQNTGIINFDYTLKQL